jgi:hypothetical protein
MPRPGGLVCRAATAGALLVGFTALPGAGPAGASPAGGGECSPGLVPATAAAFSGHIEKSHLERSPMRQVHDAEQSDYVANHRAWLETVARPSRDGAGRIGGALPSGLVAHAQQAPGTVGSLADPDAFVLGQTTWLSAGIQPAERTVTGDPC